MAAYNPYDANLLDEASKPTKQQLQEGYNTDLLQDATPSAPKSTATPRPVSEPDLEAASSGHQTEKYAAVNSGSGAAAPTSFLRSTKGKIILLVVGILVVGAVVGGAVGGTVGKHKSTATTKTTTAVTTAPGKVPVTSTGKSSSSPPATTTGGSTGTGGNSGSTGSNSGGNGMIR